MKKNHDLTAAQYSEIMTGDTCNAEPLSQLQAADIAGLTARRLQQLAHEPDAPPRAPGGGYPCTAFREWLLGRWRVGVFIDEGGRGHTYQAERARLMHFLADEAAAEEARLRESLASVGEVGELWEQIKRSVYAAFLPLPAELGARCEGLPSHEIEPAAREVVYAAMSDLSRGC